MKIIVISNYDVIREGIVSVISKVDNISVEFMGNTINEALFMIKSKYADVLLLDIHDDNKDELDLLDGIISSGIKLKLLLLDFNGNSEIFVKALKYGVQGYILGKANEEELIYALDQIYKGKKFFDAYFVDCIVNEKNQLPNKLDLLTSREREILVEVAKGLTNREISERLYITEHTVKKHINHIFDKLNFNDRTELIFYLNKHEIVNK